MIIECGQCQKTFTVPVTKDQIEDWKRGTLIQNAMPNLTPDERELFISGMCGNCFDILFGDPK